jgi:hypothetical protein
VFSEESLRRYILLVEDIHKRYRVLGETGRKDYDFKVLANFVKEFAAVWPHINENVVDSALDVDWEHDIGLVCFVETRVDQGFIYVEN